MSIQETLTIEPYNLEISEERNKMQFLKDVIEGLTSYSKRLSSKYFYDKKGDELFQKIMHCEEYYLTRSELEIFRKLTPKLVAEITNRNNKPFDLIELGVGDGIKSTHLLSYLLEQNIRFNYFPIDISGNILSALRKNFSEKFPGLEMVCLKGEYFEMLMKATEISNHRKVVMFLGSNIGNMSITEAEQFCQSLRYSLQPGDMVLIGFDLKKNPQLVYDAYNDKDGFTRDFNLNLLERINRELEGSFNIGQFRHYQNYDPDTGACKSYLVSQIPQTVVVGKVQIHFKEGETVFMEVSQKYSIPEVEELAINSGFRQMREFMDSKRWFLDALWLAV